MREIKFRAWDKERNKMYFFADFAIGTNAPSTEMRASMYDPNKPLGEDNYLYDTEADSWSSEDRIIFMQYTGLKDKNGKEIYEGDIVQAYKPNSYLDGSYAVIWDEKRGRWAYDSTFLDRMYQVGSAGNLTCEVIGNIYENEDLLNA